MKTPYISFYKEIADHDKFDQYHDSTMMNLVSAMMAISIVLKH